MTNYCKQNLTLLLKTFLFLFVYSYIFPFIMQNSHMKAQNWVQLRERMVNDQLRSRNIEASNVLNAMREVPRHRFLPDSQQKYAYEDRPLSIGFEQTISQPYIVAFMTEQIYPKPGMKVLEIGTGSGYQAAVLAHLGCKVFTIELIPELAKCAENTIKELKYNNVNQKVGNGYLGWPNEAPFDAIIVTAAPEIIPQNLINQLKDGGIMVLPVGSVNNLQYLKVVTKNGDIINTKTLMPVRFVPMINKKAE